MYPYVVTVQPKQTARFGHPTPDQRNVFHVYFPENGWKSDVPYIGDESWWEEVDFLFCQDEASAAEAARKLAQARPGYEILVSQTVSVTTSPATEPVTSKVTEKGVLPS